MNTIRDTVRIGEWYKDGYFWRKKSRDKSDGKGDLIFNTTYKIYRENDRSEWAYKALEACSELLNDRKRWADRMYDPLDAESWIERIIVRSLKKLGMPPNRYEFRYQGRMVRDSFISLYHTAMFLEYEKIITATPMVWYTYSPEIWKWKNRLIVDDRTDYKVRLWWMRGDTIAIKHKNLNF
jgi:hypothetical protein